jgi:hypothetical protein
MYFTCSVVQDISLAYVVNVTQSNLSMCNPNALFGGVLSSLKSLFILWNISDSLLVDCCGKLISHIQIVQRCLFLVKRLFVTHVCDHLNQEFDFDMFLNVLYTLIAHAEWCRGFSTNYYQMCNVYRQVWTLCSLGVDTISGLVDSKVVMRVYGHKYIKKIYTIYVSTLPFPASLSQALSASPSLLHSLTHVFRDQAVCSTGNNSLEHMWDKRWRDLYIENWKTILFGVQCHAVLLAFVSVLLEQDSK